MIAKNILLRLLIVFLPTNFLFLFATINHAFNFSHQRTHTFGKIIFCSFMVVNLVINTRYYFS